MVTRDFGVTSVFIYDVSRRNFNFNFLQLRLSSAGMYLTLRSWVKFVTFAIYTVNFGYGIADPPGKKFKIFHSDLKI